MFDDLDDLLEDNPPPKKTTVASKVSLNKFGGANKTTTLKDDFDDFDDFNDFSDNKNTWGPITKSAQNAKPPTKIAPQGTPTEKKGTQWWGGGSKTDLKPSGSKTGLNSSFGGSHHASGPGSRKSRAEEEADELDAMIGDVLGEDEPGAPQPTGTFRENQVDNKQDDIGWGKIANSGRRANNMSGPKSRGSKADDEDDLLENILDDIEEKKGIESTKARPKTAAVEHQKHESLWSAGFGAGRGQTSSRHEPGEDLDELDDLGMGGERERFSGSKQHMNQKSHDQILERKKMLFGGQNAHTSSSGAIQTTQQQPDQSPGHSRNFKNQAHAQSQEAYDQNAFAGIPSLAEQNSNSNLNPVNAGFHGTTVSATGSQESGIEVIETAYSRANKRRMMARPPTQSGAQPNEQHMQSVNSAMPGRPHTGPTSRPPLHNPQQHSLATPVSGGIPVMGDQTSEYMDMLGGGDRSYKGSQGSQMDIIPTVQPSNFNFQPRQTPIGSGAGLGQTNMLSEADFERANTDVEDNDTESYYVEEEVTDEEAMKQQAALNASADGEDANDSDDSDLGFYMPTVISKSKPSPEKKPKPAKITKTIRTKKKKTSNKKPPKSRGASPELKVKVPSPGKNILSDNPQRKSYTMSGDASPQLMQISNPGSIPQMNLVGMQGTFSNPNTSLAQRQTNQQERMLQMMDEKQILQHEIDQEKEKISQKEKSYRDQMDKMRQMHQKAIELLQNKQNEKLKYIETEKKRLIEDKTRTIELEKQKLSQLQKIDAEQREITHKKATENQKEVYSEQHDSLRKQLQQKVQMNQLAEEISKSTGDINTMVQKQSAEQEGEIRLREQQIQIREQNLAERKRAFAEKKLQLEQRQRKLASEFEEVVQRERETTEEYESEKKEIFKNIDDKDLESQQVNRQIRNRTIDIEIEVKRNLTDVTRVKEMAEKEAQDASDRQEEISIELKQIQISRQAFRKEMDNTERDLRLKLEHVESQSRELGLQERDYMQKLAEYEEENKKIIQMHDALQEQTDRFNLEKENFDRRAMAVKEQGENDQLDSEKIGFFKANKERIREEMKRLKVGLEEERVQLTEDRVKLEIFKNELKTKQKAIETMRYEYIKATSQENMMHFADQAKDLGAYKLHQQANTESYFTAKQLYPMSNSPVSPAAPIGGTAIYHLANRQSRFNYNDYMKGLNDKLSLTAPNTGKLVGTGFQEFILKERQQYLKSVTTHEHENSLLKSHASAI